MNGQDRTPMRSLRVAPQHRLSRRGVLRTLLAASLAPGIARAQADAGGTTPFSFDILAEKMQARAARAYRPPQRIGGGAASLDYDEYRKIQFREDRSRLSGPDAPFILQAYHPGWLFDTPVQLHEVVDGQARPLEFGREDFRYYGETAETIGDAPFAGVAGFRLNAPLNDADRFDEILSFLGASYFRALGRGNVYGLSARGLAINTALGGDEEFPAFTEFWIERPASGDTGVTVFAALDSPSVAGAFRFVLTPGDTTTVDVAQRLFFRDEVQQLGVAPLTSMYLFGPNDPGDFQDFRGRVHDSEALVVTSRDHSFVRPLSNPHVLANSYIGVSDPMAFGLVQRNRDFDAYLDTGAAYERRPSLVIAPDGDWGSGFVRLIEIPTDVESNDNIVAFWVPQTPVAAGDSRSFGYRMHWGMAPPVPGRARARVLRSLTGFGGVAGLPAETERRKFVIDFDASDPPAGLADGELEADVASTAGEIAEVVIEHVENLGIWRLVIEFSPSDATLSELRAALLFDGQRISETWLYQWHST